MKNVQEFALLGSQKNIAPPLIGALRRALQILRLALLAGLLAPFPAALSVWIAIELHVQGYMQRHNIVIRADLSEDYGLAFDVFIDAIIYGGVFYIIYFVMFFAIFMRRERARSLIK